MPRSGRLIGDKCADRRKENAEETGFERDVHLTGRRLGPRSRRDAVSGQYLMGQILVRAPES